MQCDLQISLNFCKQFSKKLKAVSPMKMDTISYSQLSIALPFRALHLGTGTMFGVESVLLDVS